MKIYSHRKAVIAGLIVFIMLSVQCSPTAKITQQDTLQNPSIQERTDVMLRTCFPDGVYVNAVSGCESFRKLIVREADLADAKFNHQQ